MHGFNARRGPQANMEDFESIFEDLFGQNFSTGRKQKRGSSATLDEHSEDITLKHEIDFSDAVHGTTKVKMALGRSSS